MKILVNIFRIIVGILFIFSGLIKANDPLGLSYKMQEFFESWNWQGLDHYTLVWSFTMILFEILAGVALLLGWKMNIFSWLLLLLIVFFTFLTGYALFSGKIRECGCFGNCIPLSAGQSFAKDLVLLGMIVFLFPFRNRIRPRFPASRNILILFFSFVFAFSFQWYVLHYLPVIDCLPYKIGANISVNRRPPPGAIPDSTAITLVYSKNGKEIEFTPAHFPSDFDESYHFVRRYDKLVRKGNAEAAIKDFNLITSSGTDSTQALLEEKGYTLLFFAQELPEANPAWNKEFATLFTIIRMKNMTLHFVTSNQGSVLRFLEANELRDHVQVLSCDVTAIKTAARANPTLYLLKRGTVINKWAYADFDHAITEINALPVASGDTGER